MVTLTLNQLKQLDDAVSNQDEHQDEDQDTTIENAQYMVTRPNIENTNVLRRRSSDALSWI